MDIVTTQQNWLAEKTAQIKPGRKTVAALENYLKTHYQAKEITLSKEQLRETEQKIILKHYTDVTHQKILMDIVAYQFVLEQEGTIRGTFTIALDRITEEIYTLNFSSAENQNPDQAKIQAIMRDLLLYLGVSQQDIEKKSHRFLHYIITMCHFDRDPTAEANENTDTDIIKTNISGQ